MAFTRITGRDKIKAVMDAYMRQPTKQTASFLATIFTREHRKGGIIYEGARPIAASIDETDGEVTYTLSNGDSQYTISIAFIKLSGIEYVETLNRY